MPFCKNDPKRKYKGDEPSPKGLGWCAHGEKEGKVRKGLDGNKWVVKKVSSGSLRWVKSGSDNKSIKKTTSVTKKTTSVSKKTKSVSKKTTSVTKTMRINTKWFRELTVSQKNTYKTLTTITKNELQKNGINVIICPLYLSESGYYIIDNVWEYSREYLQDSKLSTSDPFIIIVLKINGNILDLQKDKSLQIQHSNITYNNKKNLIEIFKKTFGNKYKWNGKQTHTISVKL